MSKFDAISEWLYDAGPDEECGTVEDIGWHGMYVFSADETFDGASPEAKKALKASYGAIIREDSNGFIDFTLYSDDAIGAKDLESAWLAIQADESEFHDNQEDESDESESEFDNF